MSAPLRSALAAALAVEMRSPLARIELAASQLVREAATPRGCELASSISEAVGDLDAMIARALGILVPAGGTREIGALDPVLQDVEQRLGPALAARGVRLQLAGDEPSVHGEPDLVRRAVVALLRAGAALAGEGGVLRLGLLSQPDRYGLALTLSGAARDGAVDLTSLVDASRPFALARDGCVEVREVEGRRELRLWLSQGDPTCAAS